MSLACNLDRLGTMLNKTPRVQKGKANQEQQLSGYIRNYIAIHATKNAKVKNQLAITCYSRDAMYLAKYSVLYNL